MEPLAPAAHLVALVPVKPAATAKTRLVGLAAHVREALAIAFARDAVAALSADDACRAVVVVSDEAALCPADLWVPDPGAGLNAALVSAAEAAREQWPDAWPVAVCADLPCLRPGDVAPIAAAVAGGAWSGFVPDAAGSGTSAYCAAYDVFAPRFGVGSRSAHVTAGAVEIAAGERLRRDVDTLDDLADALRLGVGAHTSAALRAADDLPPGITPA